MIDDENPRSPTTNAGESQESVPQRTSAEPLVNAASPSADAGATPDDVGATNQAPEQTAATHLEWGARLDELQATVGNGLSRLRDVFGRRLRTDRFKERQIDRLHAELEEHRRDMLARVIRPLIQGVLKIHRDLGPRVDALEQKDESQVDRETLGQWLRETRDDLELMLAEHGVQAFRSVPIASDAGASRFDPGRQRVVRRAQTQDPTMVGSIARSLDPGFEQGNTVIQKEQVEVYVQQAYGIEQVAVKDRDPSRKSEGTES